jgi:putative SOS response-associated peptidase YedK
VCPGEPLLIQRQENGRLQVGLALWGLLPDWVKDPATAHRCLHARAETVALKPSFRAAWRHRRCLIPADAFWEQGQWLRRRDGDLFWLAGLWERWIGPDGSELDSCCVLTTTPNALVAPIHRRMPVVIPNGLEQAWLEPTDGHGLRALEPLLLPWDGGDWQADGAPTALDQPQLELNL